MTKDEAVEINKDVRAVHLLHGELSAAEAIQLGIEALKAVKDSRFDPLTYISHLLPGETEE